MKTGKILLLILLCGLVFGVTRNAPEDRVILCEDTIEPSGQFYGISPFDANGNYEGNFLRVGFIGDTEGLEFVGLGAWPDDPNYYIVLDANASDPNTLSGTFGVGKSAWGAGHYEIGIHLFDSAGNDDCKWLIVDVGDVTPPSVGWGCAK